MSAEAARPKPTSFDALIVDFGGVLTSPLQDALARFAADLGIELHDLVRVALAAYSGGDDNLVVDFETGRISEEDFAVGFAERLSRASGRPVDPEGLVQRIFRLEIEESMLELVAEARAAGYRTGLCSNSWGTRLYPRDRLEPIFDVIVISGEVGLRKPDPAIFELTLSRLGLPAESCVFIDDLEPNVVGAREVGMHAVHFRDTEQALGDVLEILEAA